MSQRKHALDRQIDPNIELTDMTSTHDNFYPRASLYRTLVRKLLYLTIPHMIYQVDLRKLLTNFLKKRHITHAISS
ncbi:hypothetical protein Hanom_Chr17g01543771 [Helianthus anomalus]